MADISERTFYATKSIRRNGNSGTLYVEREWGLHKGDVVEVTVWKVDDPSNKIAGVKRLCGRGTGLVFFCSKLWGMEVGDLVTYRVRLVSNVDGRVRAED